MTEYKLTNGNTLQIIPDEYPDDPRNWDNLSVMVCFHERYNLGDKHHYLRRNYSNWEELRDDIIRKEKPVVILPLYLYDHSGITISTSHSYPYNDRWDAGQVGWVHVPRVAAHAEYNIKRITAAIKKKIEGIIDAEVKTYDQFLRGDIYGFKLLDKDGNDIDSCWGFFGEDPLENGMLEQAGIEVTELINYK